MARLAWVMAWACAACCAQPAFDVASVKVAAGKRTGGYSHRITPTSLTMLHVSMGHCLRLAYDIRTAYELVGPKWLDPPTDNEYDIEARVDRPVSEEEIKAMLRGLLAARFQLRAHRESRELPVYELVAARPSPGLRPALVNREPKVRSDGIYRTAFESCSMAHLAQQLGPPLTSRPVVDRTGLQGAYDFALDLTRYVLDESGKPILDYRGAIDSEGAILRALPEQLGLGLRPAHAPYPVLVVDHVEKFPSGN